MNPTPTPAARLLARERIRAAVEAGRDALFEDSEVAAHVALLHDLLGSEVDRIGLLLAADLAGPLALCVREDGRISTILVTPDMSEAARRDLGAALRQKTVQLLAVTPDRLSQPRFIQFVRAQSLAFVAVGAAQRLLPDNAAYHAPYESLRALRALFPDTPVLALADTPLTSGQRRDLVSALGLKLDEAAASEPEPALQPPARVTLPPPAAPEIPQPAPAPPADPPRPVEATPHRIEPSTPARPTAPPPQAATVSDEMRAVFPLFDAEKTLAEVAQAASRPEAWVCEALAAYIAHTRRSHPFPWISKPDYLRVSMAAGQAETVDPRLIRSVLGREVDPGIIHVVLAALRNRQSPNPPGSR